MYFFLFRKEMVNSIQFLFLKQIPGFNNDFRIRHQQADLGGSNWGGGDYANLLSSCMFCKTEKNVPGVKEIHLTKRQSLLPYLKSPSFPLQIKTGASLDKLNP